MSTATITTARWLNVGTDDLALELILDDGTTADLPINRRNPQDLYEAFTWLRSFGIVIECLGQPSKGVDPLIMRALVGKPVAVRTVVDTRLQARPS